MKFGNTVIETLAYALPKEILSTEAIEEQLSEVYQRLKLPTGRLELMTGIRERRLWPAGTTASQASAEAGKKALEQSNVAREDIDLLIHSAVCRDRLEPATAAYAHKLIGLTDRTQILDVSNACLGFLNALVLSAGLIESGQIKNALIVAGENGRSLIEGTIEKLKNPSLTRKSIKPYFANLTIGCAAVAAVISRKDAKHSKPTIPLSIATTRTDSGSNHLCEGASDSDGGLVMQTESELLLEAGIKLAKKTWNAFKKETQWDESSPEHIICHQVGRQHQKQLFEGLSLDIQKDYSTFPFLGNVGSVSLPITLAHALDEGRIKHESKVALLGIGSGLSSMMLALNA